MCVVELHLQCEEFFHWQDIDALLLAQEKEFG